MHVAQHVGAADAQPLGLTGAEHFADVAHAGGRQQRVAQCVCGDVTVGMAGTAVSVVEKQTQQPAWTPGFDGMDVGTEPDA